MSKTFEEQLLSKSSSEEMINYELIDKVLVNF